MKRQPPYSIENDNNSIQNNNNLVPTTRRIGVLQQREGEAALQIYGSRIPRDVLQLILSYLELRELLKAGRVSRHFYFASRCVFDRCMQKNPSQKLAFFRSASNIDQLMLPHPFYMLLPATETRDWHNNDLLQQWNNRLMKFFTIFLESEDMSTATKIANLIALSKCISDEENKGRAPFNWPKIFSELEKELINMTQSNRFIGIAILKTMLLSTLTCLKPNVANAPIAIQEQPVKQDLESRFYKFAMSYCFAVAGTACYTKNGLYLLDVLHGPIILSSPERDWLAFFEKIALLEVLPENMGFLADWIPFAFYTGITLLSVKAAAPFMRSQFRSFSRLLHGHVNLSFISQARELSGTNLRSTNQEQETVAGTQSPINQEPLLEDYESGSDNEFEVVVHF